MTAWQRSLILAGLTLGIIPPVGAQMLTGYYTGNGVDNRKLSGMSFQPDIVFIKGNTTNYTVCHTSSMATDVTKQINGANIIVTNRVYSFLTYGFQLGTNSDVNANGSTYYYMVFKAAAGEIKVGSYTGNGNDSRSITGVGFQPDYVIVMSTLFQSAVHRSSTMSGDVSFWFDTTASAGNLIQALEADGFQVGTHNAVNANFVTFHYIAWKTTASRFAVGSYAGNGTDSRSITGVGFAPESIFVKDDLTDRAAWHTGSLGFSTDSSLNFSNATNFTDGIQALESDGFQVGTDVSVNTSTGSPTYYYAAFGRNAPNAVRLLSFEARDRGEDGVELCWRTGHEVNNLGFHLYREEKGERTRITTDLVAGSAFLVGERTRLKAGHSYSFRDPTPAKGEATHYWLEDVDLRGGRESHGPFLPEPSGERSDGGRGEDSTALSRAGKSGAEARCRVTVRETLWPEGDDEPPGGAGGAAADSASGPVAPANLRDAASSGGGASEPPVAGSLRTQWEIAGGSSVKIAIREEGWCRVSQEELLAAGLSPRIRPGSLRLYSSGFEEPVLVTGGRDGRLDRVDSIEFYGRGRDTPSTDTRLYWLVAGDGQGRRVGRLKDPHRRVATGGRSFPLRLESRERTVYFAALKNGDEENFFGPVIAREAVEERLALRHLDPQAPARLAASIQGVSDVEHRVRIRLNGVEAGEATCFGKEQGLLEVDLPEGLLQEGENTVSFDPVPRAGGESDVSLVDRVSLTHGRTYTADGNALRCTVPALEEVKLGGFTTPAIRVVDVTRPALVKILGGMVERDGAGYAVRVKVSRDSTLYAYGPSRVGKAAWVAGDRASRWHDGGEGAEVVIIGPGNLLSRAEPLRALHESEGLGVAMVDLEDVYDEFGYGEKSPEALKAFLERARGSWKLAPRWVLLLGDATFDPRDYLGRGSYDLLPTKLVETENLETASDDWFVDFDNDGIPELAIGRIPARTEGEVDKAVSKIVEYAQRSPGSSGGVVLVADRPDGTDFESESELLAGQVPPGIEVREIFRAQTDDMTARSALLAEINRGQMIVNYLGHGSTEVLRGDLLTSQDAGREVNGPGLSCFVLMDCLGGFFQDLYTESLAEALLLKSPSGGAAAVWASSGICGPEGQGAMDRELFRLLFEEDLTLGEAAARAKAAAESPDLRRTWILFGDPATRVR